MDGKSNFMNDASKKGKVSDIRVLKGGFDPRICNFLNVRAKLITWHKDKQPTSFIVKLSLKYY